MSFELLVYTGGEDGNVELHESVYQRIFEDLRNDKYAIYAFLKSFEKVSELDISSLTFNSCFVEVLTFEEMVMEKARDLALDLGLTVFEPINEKTYFPVTRFKNNYSAEEMADIDQFMRDYDDLMSFELDSRFFGKEGLRELELEAQRGNECAMYSMALSLFSRAEQYVSPFGSSKSGKLELLAESMKYADGCSSKKFAATLPDKIRDAMKSLS